MSDRNELITVHLRDARRPAVCLAMGERAFGVLSASGPFVIQCLHGEVWITQEANSNDVILCAGDRCAAAKSQKVFLNSLKGVRLRISHATASARRPLDLRVEITRGRYTLSGGTPGRPAAPVPQRRPPAQQTMEEGQTC